MSLAQSARYFYYGLISNAAIKAYYYAPRETIQDECLNLHRWALKRAHHARMANRVPNVRYCACGNPAAVRYQNDDLCSSCYTLLSHQPRPESAKP